MTDFVSAMTKAVIGLGHNTEDGNPTPIIFRHVANPLSGGGSPQPQAGLSKTVTGSPYAENNPLPL